MAVIEAILIHEVSPVYDNQLLELAYLSLTGEHMDCELSDISEGDGSHEVVLANGYRKDAVFLGLRRVEEQVL